MSAEESERQEIEEALGILGITEIQRECNHPKLNNFPWLTAIKQKEYPTMGEIIASKLVARFTLGLMDPNAEFRECWKMFVPRIYALQENQDCLVPFRGVAENVDKKLIEPLVLFLSGGHGSDTFFDFLSATDKPSTICGRVFQVGEATYTCRECGMDPTCVLCVDCFKSSVHKTHRYKIATSQGGGYCDCGDQEAWKDHVYCSTHMPKDHTEVDIAPEAEGLEERAAALFKTIIRYCNQMTTSELTTRLPEDLIRKNESSDPNADELYCTVLYNDETHTFDLVIQTLTRALGCFKKDAIEYATTIDREGRSIVKVNVFTPCEQVKSMIERQTSRNGGKPLKCVVMQSQVIAHQTFALRLLSWLESICSHSGKLRSVVAQILFSPSEMGLSLIEGIILSDTKLWKAARTCWHRLVISALLKDYDTKKRFAMIFTRHYADMMKDFILDDHDHSFSITSLSVQIFTVPSIAHFLVEEHDVLFTIMRTLLSECEQRLNNKQKLEFDRASLVNNLFKRTNFAILDLKYVLTNPPTEWSIAMVKHFTHAIDSFLKLLSYMQEMDAVTRQVGQHMEYEPEWESAFNLHIKLQPVVQLSLEWCSSNKPVFVRAFRHCLSDLSKAYCDLKSSTVTLELANHSATCYVYDVASQPVSVHLPLTRYFAGLYLHLEKFELEFVSTEFNLLNSEKPVPEMIMEPALRTQVLIAQVNAGMWKRNGYALLNQLYFYHNVRCRTDMLDRDILTLQIAASLIESNEFLLHVINRFGLYQWTDPNFDEKTLKPQSPDEDMGKYLASLADEFFGLIITIVSARYNPGVGQVTRKDCIKKEVIQQLCIEPMTHSTLNKSLVENVNYETGLELVIQEVANLKEPTAQRTSVVYELKPEYLKDYDVYHYHYTREEMSKAEEKQRERKRTANEPEFFPPTVLPPFTNSFNMVVNVLQSDVLLQLISLVLGRNLAKCGRIPGESLMRKVLHLLGHGLNEEIARNEKEQEHFFQFSENAKRWKIFDQLDRILRDPMTTHCHDMILWLKRQYNRLKPSENSMDEANPPYVSQPNEEEERKRKAERVREAKAKMMAKMAAAQQQFMAVNKDLFTEEACSEEDETEATLEDTEMTPVETIALGPNQTQCYLPDERYVCIFCQEDQALVVGSKRFVLAAFVQRSTVLSNYREKLIEESNFPENTERKCSLLEERSPLYLVPDLISGPIVSTCGHIMHEGCWASHIETVFNKERRRPYRLRHPLSFDVDKHEWLCPMCDSICNAALPMSVALPKLYPIPSPESSDDLTERSAVTPASFDVWIQGMQIVVKNKWTADRSSKTRLNTTEEYKSYLGDVNNHNDNLLYMVGSVSLQSVVEELEDHGKSFELLHPRRPMDYQSPTYKWLTSGFFNRLASFMTLTYTTGLDLESNEDDFRTLLMMWQSLAFTILGAEAYHRDQAIPFFGPNVPNRKVMGLKYLTRACGVASDRQKPWVEYMRCFALRILSTLLQNHGTTPSLFECDAFGLLVVLTFSMPALFVEPTSQSAEESEDESLSATEACQPPTGTCLDHHILRLTFMYHVSQILVTNDFSNCYRATAEGETTPTNSSGTCPESMDTSDQEADSSSQSTSSFTTRKQCIFGEVWRIAKKDTMPFRDMSLIDCDTVWREICQATIPFLRCAAKLYENLTGITPPISLEKPESSFEDLMSYLDLPRTFDELFDTPFTWQIPYKWASHPCVGKILNTRLPSDYKSYPRKVESEDSYQLLPSHLPITYPRRLGLLVDLPEDYTELINMVSTFTCKNCNTLDSRTPTMCLTCGEILCSQIYYNLNPAIFKQSYCCQRMMKQTNVGACVYHAYYCGGGYGIFLRIRECKLFFIGGKNRGCFVNPPYLDEYGEVDQGLRRGNPLTLCKEKYDVFRKIWLQHGIPEEIARITEHKREGTVMEPLEDESTIQDALLFFAMMGEMLPE